MDHIYQVKYLHLQDIYRITKWANRSREIVKFVEPHQSSVENLKTIITNCIICENEYFDYSLLI